MIRQSCLKDGIPWTIRDHLTLDDLSPVDQRKTLAWIKQNIHYSSTGETYSSYGLKHHMEHDIGLYVTNNQFKHAMLRCGFQPIDETELNWEYPVDSDKSPQKVALDAERKRKEEKRKQYEAERLATFLQNIISESKQDNSTTNHGIVIENGDGQAIGIPPDVRVINFSPPPYVGHIAEILIEDTGAIYFDENKDAFRSILEFCDRSYLLKLLGQIGEAIIVHRCKESPKINQIWLSFASGAVYDEEDASDYTAVGTGFKSTLKTHPRLYNPHDTQNDIIWADYYGHKLIKRLGSDMVGNYVALQVKVSTKGKNYVLDDLRNSRYEIPIAYYPLSNDFEELLSHVPSAHRGVDIINVKDVDPSAFQEMQYYWSLLKALHERKITPEGVIREATTLPVLKNGISATSMNLITIPAFIL